MLALQVINTETRKQMSITSWRATEGQTGDQKAAIQLMEREIASFSTELSTALICRIAVPNTDPDSVSRSEAKPSIKTNSVMLLFVT